MRPLVVVAVPWQAIGIAAVLVVDTLPVVGKPGGRRRAVVGTPTAVVGRRAVAGTRVVAGMRAVAGMPPAVAGMRTEWRPVAGKHCRPARLAREPVAGPVDFFPVVCRPAATVGFAVEICTWRTHLV